MAIMAVMAVMAATKMSLPMPLGMRGAAARLRGISCATGLLADQINLFF